MPPNRYSRLRFCTAYIDPVDGHRSLSEPEPYVFRELSDTIMHVVVEGDTFWKLAGRYYDAFPDPSLLWWVIADFQPAPGQIFDPTLTLAPGTLLYIPSVRTVHEQILSDRRRGETAPE